MTFCVSRSAVFSQPSHRLCMGRMSPPPAPTMITPPMVARMVMSTGVVTVVATSTWFSAAITPRNMMKIEAMLASTLP